MLEDHVSLLEERVIAIIRTVLPEKAGDRALSADDDLHERGMTSLNMVNLMLAIEAGFGIFIPRTDLHPDNFRSVRAIEALVSRIADA